MRIPIVLASASPRRRELFARLRVPFEVCPSDVDERPWARETPEALVRRLARAKATKAFAHRRASVVLAADTIVAVDDDILGKPADHAEARRMLRRLSDRSHRVSTGFCILGPGGQRVDDVVRSDVRFRAIDDGEIDAYLATGEPFDKAGAYAIQGGAADFVAELSGSYDNVVGLPLDEVAAALERFVRLPERGGAPLA